MPTDLKSCRLAAYLNYSLFNIHHSLFIVLGAVSGRVNDLPLQSVFFYIITYQKVPHLVPWNRFADE